MVTRPEITGRKTGRRLLDYQALKERGIPWTRVHLARLEAVKKFPLHIDVGDNSVAWFEDEIDDFLEAKAAERDAKAAERAAKADSSITDTDCGRQSPGEVQSGPLLEQLRASLELERTKVSDERAVRAGAAVARSSTSSKKRLGRHG